LGNRAQALSKGFETGSQILRGGRWRQTIEADPVGLRPGEQIERHHALVVIKGQKAKM
jgi:hypothetical protein